MLYLEGTKRLSSPAQVQSTCETEVHKCNMISLESYSEQFNGDLRGHANNLLEQDMGKEKRGGKNCFFLGLVYSPCSSLCSQ